MNETVSTQTLQEMIQYYRQRAQEYDEWFYRQGRYDRGDEENARWFAETEMIVQALKQCNLTGDVLELAPGTGLWTERLVKTASHVTAVDASEEMLAINRSRVGSERVTYLLADLFDWQPERTYDGIFFGFWLSHVPVERLESFLGSLTSMLRPDGRLFFVDSLPVESSSAINHTLPEPGSQLQVRRLNDGRSFEIVKNFYQPAYLSEACSRAGLEVRVNTTPTYFIYGTGKRL